MRRRFGYLLDRDSENDEARCRVVAPYKSVDNTSVVTRDGLEDVPDEFAEENFAIEAFVEERSERFVLGSRETVLEELLAHTSATGGNNYLCLTGMPGSGNARPT